MCGIYGVVKKRGNAAEDTYAGLQRLEYRGYDSAGLSVLSGGQIFTVKRAGRVQNIQSGAAELSGSVAIGHTRWATHGQPTDANAHPHATSKFSVVHNGIIENFRELKEELVARNIAFLSDTDSEVIVKLIDLYYKGDPVKAVAAAVGRLQGSFALGILCADFDGVIAVKYKSPVVIGFGEDEVTLCSDVPALPQNTSAICVPQDGDIVVMQSHGVRFLDADLNIVERIRRPVFLGQFAQGKGEYDHFMIKEINESERTVIQTCEGFFRYVDINKLTALVRRADRIIITGCGTAYNAGLLAKRYFNERCGVYCQAEIASELRYSKLSVTPATLVLAVSQSGETADTVEAVLALKDAGATVVAVTNCGYSAITRVAHITVPVCAGAEVCVAATKSYLGQLAALYLIASLTGDVSAARENLLQTAAKISGVIEETACAEKIANACANSSAVFFLGRGIDYAVAVEASLKLKEISYIFSDGYPAGELKHGTLALIDENTLSVFVICEESLAEKCKNAASQVASRKGKVAVITSLPEVAEELKDSADVWLIPECPPVASPFLSAVALQLIAYRTAVILHRDPDKPRNLAKSVTVE
ncbi:MAG: glutamine--fructose-6-phosphate transaminase (isomerizing) [Clostridia bacterium]|nr:glutamine--fructose-6-phosphate transaminase (isomerizing) [Clostridia bacterium]